MEGFTPVLSMIGGVLVGFAAIALLYFNGRIAGISGMMGGVLRPQQGDTLWRAVFLAGLLTGAALILLLHPAAMDLRFDISDSTIILGGFLVGAGLFGIGWGPVGLCPGPAMTALVSGHPEALIFFTAMVTGMYAHRTVEQFAENRTPTGSMSDG